MVQQLLGSGDVDRCDMDDVAKSRRSCSYDDAGTIVDDMTESRLQIYVIARLRNGAKLR